MDLLLLNAGNSQHALAEDTMPDVHRQMLDLNVLGPLNLTRAALPHMLRR